MILAKTVFLILLWWIANGLTSLYSKTEMSKARYNRSFTEMNWLDLTIMQFLFGIMGSAVWVYFIQKKSLSIEIIRNWNGFVVVLGNLIGHLSVNISYTFVSSSSTQVVKSLEPIFMFFFLFLFRPQHHKQTKNVLVFLSVILMVLGACFFVIWDITFNVWGIGAAIISNVAFPLRNIALKNIDRRYESPFEKYFILSLFGIILLVPFLLFKMIFLNVSSSYLSQAGITAASFHCVYNLASISVLQSVSALNHAILNLSKRIFVIILNIKYFNLVMTWQMFVGLLITFLGLAIYLLLQNAKSSSSTTATLIFAKISSSRFCQLFLVASLLTMLSTFLYLPMKTIKIHSSHYQVNHIEKTGSNVLTNGNVSRFLTTTWVFNKPMSDAFIESVVSAHVQTGASVHMFCGTMRCLETIDKLNIPMITASFLVVPHAFENTPLKEWGERHVLYKLVTGLHYEWYLTQALCLGHLWQYGGSFYLPSYGKINWRVRNEDVQENWPCMLLENVPKGNISAFRDVQLLPRDEHVKQKIETFLRMMESWKSKKVPSMFEDTVWNAFSRHCPNSTRWCLIQNPRSLRDLYEQEGIPFEDEHHFGTLSYDSNVGHLNRPNIGDEIQSITGIQFLPFLDFFLDRENQIAPDTRGKHIVFFNAWWGSRRFMWPPPENIDPVMVSVHTNWRFRGVISHSSKIISFLKAKMPIGARDVVTKGFMESLGIQSFFSGCMTLFLRNPQPAQERNDTIYIVDVNTENQNLLPEWVIQKAKFVAHNFDYGEGRALMTKERFLDAYKLLEKYSRAKLVITQRIHAALPCVAMGTPVLFFNGKKMPGGGGTSTKASERVKGLVDLFHTINLHGLTTEQVKDQLKNFDWNNPSRNPNLASRMRMVSSMWFIFRRHQAIYESARRFGMFPLTPQWLMKKEPMSHVFHVIHDDVRSPGRLKWHQWRCIESILRYHPTSRLFVYSNTIQQTAFDVLTEVGYQVTLMNYKVPDIVEPTVLKVILSQFEETLSSEISLQTTLHQLGVLRLFLLYKYGGIYLEEDTIVLKTINISSSNVISLDPESNVNPWILNFEKNHEFLRVVLEMFPTMYSAKLNPDEGKALLTKLWKEWQGNAGNKPSIILAKKKYYCLEASEALHKKYTEIIKDEVHVIRILDVEKCLEKKGTKSQQLKQGTICKKIYNEHCLFCSNQY